MYVKLTSCLRSFLSQKNWELTGLWKIQNSGSEPYIVGDPQCCIKYSLAISIALQKYIICIQSRLPRTTQNHKLLKENIWYNFKPTFYFFLLFIQNDFFCIISIDFDPKQQQRTMYGTLAVSKIILTNFGDFLEQLVSTST